MGRTVKLVTFGLGGDTAYYSDGARGQGYGSPERPHAGSGEVIPDGTPAVDTRAAVDTDEGYLWAFRGPMVDVNIADGDINACPDPEPFMVAGLSGSYVGLVGMHMVSRAKREARGPLDFVSVREYVDGWREHGARVGRYLGGAIVWE